MRGAFKKLFCFAIALVYLYDHKQVSRHLLLPRALVSVTLPVLELQHSLLMKGMDLKASKAIMFSNELSLYK